jgi:chromosome segregation ATPase
MQPKKKQENDILIEVKKIGRRLEEFQTSTEGKFGEVNGHFARIDEQFSEVGGRFAKIDKQFSEVNGHFIKIDEQFNGVDGQFAKIDERFGEVNVHFTNVDKRFNEVNSNIEELVVATAQEFNEVRKEIGEMATKTELHELKQEVMQAIDRVDTHLSATASQWHDDFDEVKDLPKEHDGRIRILEKYHRPA